MELLKKKKMLIIITVCGIFIIGIISLLCEKSKDAEIRNLVQNVEANNGLTKNNDIEEGKVEPEEDVNKIENNENIIYIHIIGEVNNTGIIKLREGQRIVDAIELAGGVTEKADLSKVNLAYVLSDGQQVNIPNIYEDNTDFKYVTEGSGSKVITDEGNKAIGSLKKVNINTATQTELETLTGIGPSLATKIIDYRKTNGNFKSIDELKNVSGIGESKFESIKNMVVVN